MRGSLLNTFGEGQGQCTHYPMNRAMLPQQIDYIIGPREYLHLSNAEVDESTDVASDHRPIVALVAVGDRLRRTFNSNKPPTSLFAWKCRDRDRFREHSTLCWNTASGNVRVFSALLAQSAREFAVVPRKRR
eukprot:12114425-Alexandrium_andersonii.AAC.1